MMKENSRELKGVGASGKLRFLITHQTRVLYISGLNLRNIKMKPTIYKGYSISTIMKDGQLKYAFRKPKETLIFDTVEQGKRQIDEFTK